VRAVSSLPALNWLDISYCDVTAAGVQALRDTTAAPSLTIEWGELEDSEDDLEDTRRIPQSTTLVGSERSIRMNIRTRKQTNRPTPSSAGAV
jgi:hypothetical protein